MRNELNNLVATLRETASHIEDRLKATDPNINLDISTPTPETLASEIRGQVFKVFRLTANLLGRSGDAAVLADTKAKVQQLFLGGIVSYKPEPGRKKEKTGNPVTWVEGVLTEYLDPDMTIPAQDGIVPALNPVVYQNPGTIIILKRFYESLLYWYRHRLLLAKIGQEDIVIQSTNLSVEVPAYLGVNPYDTLNTIKVTF